MLKEVLQLKAVKDEWMTLSSGSFYRFIRLFHFTVYRFEHFFSQPPWVLIRGRNDFEDFAYWYDIGLNTRFTFPLKSSAIFNELLTRLKKKEFPEKWAAEREARINYYLGTLAEDLSEKISYLKRCQTLMPNHYSSRELLFELTGENVK